jgi:signal transduction histidine kinase
LNNVIKHARATQVHVTLWLNNKVNLSIVDNGNGFDVNAVSPQHYGLKIMRERAEAVGAVFSIYSEPGEGTQVIVSWVPPDFDAPSLAPMVQTTPEAELNRDETQIEKENG